MASLLEKTANIFLIVACSTVIGEYGYRFAHPTQQATAFSSGARIEGTAALGLKSAPRTLIIATSSTRPYCNASMPFYKQTADLAREKGTRLVAITAETPQVNRTFLEAHGITVETVLTQSASGIHVPHLPTLILVRSDGTILNAWEGQPRDTSVQRSVLRALEKS